MTREEAISYATHKLKKLSHEEQKMGYVTDSTKIELKKEIEFLNIAIINMKLAKTFQMEELKIK